VLDRLPALAYRLAVAALSYWIVASILAWAWVAWLPGTTMALVVGFVSAVAAVVAGAYREAESR
jgi:hypothetical protein